MKLKLILTPFSILVFLLGCASAPKTTEIQSGFLTDYSKLKETDENSASFIAEGYEPKQYGSITFDPVQVQLSEALLNDSSLEANQQKEISEFVASELDQKLSSGFSGQGQGSLKIRSAVSGVSSTSEDLSAWQYLPVTLAATAAMEAAGQRDKALILFLEAEAIDLDTNEIVAAKVEAHELGLVDNSDFEEDPIGTIKPLLAKWIDEIMLKINKQIQ